MLFYAVEIKTMLGENFHNMMIVIRHGFNYLTLCHFFSVLEREREREKTATTFILPPGRKDDLNIAALFKTKKKLYSFIRQHNKVSERLNETETFVHFHGTAH